MAPKAIADPAGLYVHVPFCARACPYCDFDFEVGALDQVPGYLEGIRVQVEQALTQGWDGFDTIYLGGGTPSILNPAQLESLFTILSPLAEASATQEVTVEFNPEHAHPQLLAALGDLRVSRVSLGVQSFEQKGLVSLGRAHRAQMAQFAIEEAMQMGLDVSCDLMVGWPGQTVQLLAADLATLTALGVPHISIYALTIEPGSNWPSLVQRGLRNMPDADEQGDRLAQVHDTLQGAGYVHYEVASYAKTPQRIARHNAKYWSGQDYLGLGPSAHSARFDATGRVCRWGMRRGLANWLADPTARVDEEELAGEDSACEALWLGLRRLDGLGLATFLCRFPQVDREWLWLRTQRLRERGLLEWQGETLRVAPGSWLMHDEIAQELL